MSSHTFKVGDRVYHAKTNRMGKVVAVFNHIKDIGVDFGDAPYAPCVRPSELTPIQVQDEPPASSEPSTPSPIKTVKQIVGGRYGIVGVSVDRQSLLYVEVEECAPDAAQLREAARVFTELADALDAGEGE